MFPFKTNKHRHQQSSALVLFSLILGMAALGFSSCETKLKPIAQFEEADLMGVAYDGRARSIQGFEITVDDRVMYVSDVNGRFTIPALKNGTHKIVGKKAGYQPVTMTLDFHDRTQFLYLTSNALIDFLNDAELALAKKDYLLAQANIDAALGIDHSNLMALYMQALISNDLNNSAKAYEIIESMIQLNSHEEAMYLLLLDIAKTNPELKPRIIAEIQSNPALLANPRLKNRLDKLTSDKK